MAGIFEVKAIPEQPPDAAGRIAPSEAGAEEQLVKGVLVGPGLLNGLSIEDLQRWTLIYLGISALAFVLVWLIGYLRRAG